LETERGWQRPGHGSRGRRDSRARNRKTHPGTEHQCESDVGEASTSGQTCQSGPRNPWAPGLSAETHQAAHALATPSPDRRQGGRRGGVRRTTRAAGQPPVHRAGRKKVPAMVPVRESVAVRRFPTTSYSKMIMWPGGSVWATGAWGRNGRGQPPPSAGSVRIQRPGLQCSGSLRVWTPSTGGRTRIASLGRRRRAGRHPRRSARAR